MFKVKDEVVYPGHGVAVVEEILEKVVEGKTKIFFQLKFKFKPVTILVPKEKLEQTKVRFISKEEEVRLALEELATNHDSQEFFKTRDIFAGGWSKRQKELQARLESGVLGDIVKAYRELKSCSERKSLSFGEKGLLELAEDLLSQEIQAATKKDEKQVLDQIRSSFREKAQQL